MFDGGQKFKIDKPIRLIELFGGYGSQALALKYLGVKFTHWKLSEWAVPSIQAYKDLHATKDDTDYSIELSKEQLLDYLDGRISMDYSKPMTREQIERKGEKWQRVVYNNMKATNNCGSIIKMSGQDLNVVDTDKYGYYVGLEFDAILVKTVKELTGAVAADAEVNKFDIKLGMCRRNKLRGVLRIAATHIVIVTSVSAGVGNAITLEKNLHFSALPHKNYFTIVP
jgi:hypothetical protein